MATIGYTTIGGSTATTDPTDNVLCLVAPANRYTASSGDTVTSYSVYGSGSGGDPKVTLYTWNGSVPVTRLAAGTTVTIGSTPGWYTATVSQALVAGTTYVVGIDDCTGTIYTIYYDVVNQESVDFTTSLPATWSEGTTAGVNYSVYATITPAGGTSASPSVSPSISPSVSPSQSPSASQSPSVSPSVSPSQSPSASKSPSVSPSQSPSASISPSPSPSVPPTGWHNYPLHVWDGHTWQNVDVTG